MKRKNFDKIVTAVGFGLAVFLLIAAGKAAMLDTVFKGNVLRGTLLTAYAFGTLGSIAGISALVFLAGALVMLLLSILGLLHIRRADEDATI